MRHALPALALALAACSGQSSNDAAEQQADKLDNAAEQSTGAAADVLHNEADAIRENGTNSSPGAPGSAVQNAMDRAGAAQSDGTRQAPAPGVPPVPKQAAPQPAPTPGK
jgi:hypothetical protein